MKSRRMWAVLAVAIAGVVGSGFTIPAAVGASPQTTAVTGMCIAKGTKLLSSTGGAVGVSVKGNSKIGTGSCAGKLTGVWAKNSTKFLLQSSGQGTLGITIQPDGAIPVRGSSFTLPSGTDLSPLTSAKLAGNLNGTGLATGTALTIATSCAVSYAPLRLGCTITISW